MHLSLSLHLALWIASTVAKAAWARHSELSVARWAPRLTCPPRVSRMTGARVLADVYRLCSRTPPQAALRRTGGRSRVMDAWCSAPHKALHHDGDGGATFRRAAHRQPPANIPRPTVQVFLSVHESTGRATPTAFGEYLGMSSSPCYLSWIHRCLRRTLGVPVTPSHGQQQKPHTSQQMPPSDAKLSSS